MDTSETYIKMCEKAEEIQGLRGDEFDGNLGGWLDGDYSFQNLIVHPQYRYNDIGRDIKIIRRSDGFKNFRNFTTPIWLPRQDQLQEMMGYDYKDWLGDFVGFVFDICHTGILPDSYAYQFTSMEQLWLAFVMKEKYGKIWNGEDWIKEE